MICSQHYCYCPYCGTKICGTCAKEERHECESRKKFRKDE
jgi:hypothetical protein